MRTGVSIRPESKAVPPFRLPGPARFFPTLRPLSLRPLSALLAVLAPVAAVMLGGCGSHKAAHPASPTTTGKAASIQGPAARPQLESIFEPKGPLFADPAGTLDLMRTLGVDRVKVFIPWNQLAPDPSSRVRPQFNATDPAAYSPAGWSGFDTIARDAKARGIALYFAVGGLAPLWATGHDPAPGGPYDGAQWEPSAAQFGRFVRAVATRYSGHYTPPGDSSPLPRVSFWSIWNEPNLGSADLAPQAIDNSTVEVSPAMYRGLVDSAWSALQATGHGSDRILIGELAPYGQTFGNSPGNYGEMVPMRFVRALYCVDASEHPLQGSAAAARGCPTTSTGSKRFATDHPGLFQASGFAIHPYPSGQVPPNVVLPDGPGFVNLASLPRLAQLLDAVTTLYGSSKRFPFYMTEYGYFTKPPYAGGAPLRTAAADINWAEYLAWRDPRIRSYDQYLLEDPDSSSRSSFVTGLEFSNGVHKPSYEAYRMPIYLPVTRTSPGRSLEVWGCARPAHYVQLDTGAAQRVQIQLQAPSGGPFKTVKSVIPDPQCYFDVQVAFPSSGSVRLAWSYPHGPTIYSRTMAVSIA